MADTASPRKPEPREDPPTLKPEQNGVHEPQSGERLSNGGSVVVQTNGHHPENAALAPNGHDAENHDPDDSERPAKRQRTRDTTPTSSARKPKPISPPWKQAAADGPTSFTENGRRKSGRINLLPLDLQPPAKRRTTRGSLGGQTKTPKKGERSASSRLSRTAAATPVSRQTRKSSISQPAPNSSSKSSAKKSAATPKSATRARRRSPSPPPVYTRHSTRPTRSSRHTDTDINDGIDLKRSPRNVLRALGSGEIPLVHPGQVPKRPKLGASFEDFWARAGGLPVEEGGLQASEDGPYYTDELALRDARIIMRIEDELTPGGLLAPGRCSLFAPEGDDDVPRQWARQDHLVKAVANFRKLLVAEQQRHRFVAKKLAEACRDEWIRRQPKSAEQLEAEARELCLARYKQVLKAMTGTWENVRAYVNKQRLEEWEVEEQKRVKAALNEAVNLSEQKLQARRAGLDSEPLSDDDGFDDLSDDMSDDISVLEQGDSDLASDEGSENDSDEDSDVMSSSEDEDGEDVKDAADEGLTQEQLRLKYANIPDLDPGSNEDATDAPTDAPTDAATTQLGAETTDVGAETTDESIDMDDDLGSSDMGEAAGSGESEEEVSEDDVGGMLGLLFDKSELKKLEQEVDSEAPTAADDDYQPALTVDAEQEQSDFSDAFEDDDEVTLIQHPDAFEKAEMQPADNQPTVEQPVEKSEIKSLVNGEHSDEENLPTSPVEADAMDLDEEPVEEEAVPVAAQPEEDMETMVDVGGEEDLEHNLVSPKTDEISNPRMSQPSQSPDTTNAKASEVESLSALVPIKSTVDETRSESPSKQSTNKTEVPFLLRGTLREYQRDGLDWLAGLYANHTNGILADEMGLGKTIQTIALLAHLADQHEVWGPHLVIVPTSVMLNWEMEFKKWCPGFKILAYYGTQDERKRKRQGWNNDDVWNVCITSYQLVLQDQQVFKRRRWHYMILDEAHNIKNFKSQRWQTLLGFNTRARLLLTGTPLQNNLTELWSLLFFLMPAQNGEGGFADLQEFHEWFHKPESQILESGREQMDEEAKAIISKLHKVLRPYLLRRLKADVEKQMPAKYEHVEFCRLSKRQRELYDGFLSRSDTKETLSSGNYLSIINCLMQLRKVCNHPDLFIDRPIMTSFRQRSSVPAEYQVTEQRVQRILLKDNPMRKVDLGFLNLVPTKHESQSSAACDRVAQLSSYRIMIDMKEAQRVRAQLAYSDLDPLTVASTVGYLESASRWGRFEELQHSVYVNALRRQQKPIYGSNLVQMLTMDAHKRPCRPRPKLSKFIMRWFEDESSYINALTPSLDERADEYKLLIEKFTCVTPAVVTRDMNEVLLGRKAAVRFTDEDLKLSAPVRWAPFLPKQTPPDPWHEARMRHTIQFPDKRLLQYDCGKLQALDKLLRKLQSGGHRALIFTQMTKVLDILEQFLNIHGHKYLRLDGATKVEQRQILTDRFNRDPRILCFILSTRSGGLGINLTGADTVIFYDQDWNPAMDKQCQDRCHRIGQTRDVHIYRLVSEHTIEANILRKASQKQMLDDVVIQEGEFTTDYFNKLSIKDVLADKVDNTSEGVSAADAALDRVLGGPDSSRDQRTVGRALEQAEDREDVAAARVAEKEIHDDDADFTEKASGQASGASTARQGTPLDKADVEFGEDGQVVEVELNAYGERIGTIDEFMLAFMREALRYTKLDLPRDKKKAKKKGKDTRKR
ncbi:SNF2 family domain-containing protein [Beauveria bassiana ARSEF 2860]|uniref:DNA helicase n=1 Tax=Beauveria bassiana (strain ARSEF 2860) TaxID=655819 RepID=J4WDM4_BEAB2|nr:SNF2 family domain-containing protein [Beauveria bassiana ARSEF 2860]EJP68125.1 SNF2 family domain-containing protein [Beauveria bassiana ARSEF 2860]